MPKIQGKEVVAVTPREAFLRGFMTRLELGYTCEVYLRKFGTSNIKNLIYIDSVFAGLLRGFKFAEIPDRFPHFFKNEKPEAITPGLLSDIER